MLAVRANAGLTYIVIRAGDVIVAVWTSSIHLKNRRNSYIRLDFGRLGKFFLNIEKN